MLESLDKKQKKKKQQQKHLNTVCLFAIITGNGYTFMGGNSVKTISVPFWKRVYFLWEQNLSL